MPVLFFSLLTLMVLVAPPASAELTADQVVVLANKASTDSLNVARHYVSRRGIPPSNLINVDVPTDETISREAYNAQLVRPLREALIKQGLATKARVLVTTFGIPLRVQAPPTSPTEATWVKDAEERRNYARFALEQSRERLARIAPAGTAPASTKQNPPGGEDLFEALVQDVTHALREAGTRIQAQKEKASKAQLDQWTNDLAKVAAQLGGQATLVQALQPSGQAMPDQARAQLDRMRQQIALIPHVIQALNESPSDANRRRTYRLTEQAFGQVGVARLAAEEIDSYRYAEGDASVDSELSLLWWEPGEYRVARRVPNPLFHEFAVHAEAQPGLPILMVSRLDAPTAKLAMELVDHALAAEQQGLAGTIYLDARGMKEGPPLSYEAYDQSLRDLSGRLQRARSAHEVVLENTDRRFSRPGEAPNVALYVGWYKLRQYEDAFTFRPGAFGFHMASGEAVSLHDPHEPGWCKNALERGITATLGPIGEPYLDAFPLPDELLSLWLTGRYTLVEVCYLTTRFVSWRMVLIGDPLYNPWKTKPVFSVGDVSVKTARGLSPAPASPSERSLPDPVQGRKLLAERREKIVQEVDKAFEQQDQQARKAVPQSR
ncbi:MAG: TIGR03790 family protein [Nitrospirae bacterium]|nr:TIGR03790 family protein [Nitrospirota bacterium]